MFVLHLGFEVKGEMKVESEPEWPKIQEALEKLDGEARTLVALEATPEVHMSIGGGENGWCVLGVFWTDGKFYRLVDPAVTENPGEVIELTVAGVKGAYLREMLIPQAAAVKVAKPFAEEGVFDPAFEWREQIVGEYKEPAPAPAA